MTWGIIAFLGIAGLVLINMRSINEINSDDVLEIWMAPGSGRLFIYNPRTRMMENDEYGKAEVSGNTDQWVLEKIGEL